MTMYSKVYICEKNRELTPFDLTIPTDFYYIFQGRKIVKEKFDEEFPAPNGHYFEFSEYYDEDSISFNLKVCVDKDGVARDFSSYRLRDLGGGPKGSCEDVVYRKKDYKAIYDLLSEVLVNPGESLFEEICSKLKSGCELPNGFVFLKKTSKALILKNTVGEKVSLKITNLLDKLSLILKFIEIAYSEEFLRENQYYFEPELVSLYHSLFALIDYKKLPKYKTLIKEANNRIELRKALDSYDDLLKACKNNDIKKAKKYISAAKLVVCDNEEADFPLLCAVKNDNYELAKLLLENGALAIQIALQSGPMKPYRDFDEENNYGALSALYVATIHQNKDMMKLIVSYNGNKQYSDLYNYEIPFNIVTRFRIDELLNYLIKKDDAESIRTIIENLEDSDHIYPIRFRKDSGLELNDIKWFAEQTIHRIEWPSKLIAKAFHKNKKIYNLMLKQCYCEFTKKIKVSIDEAVKQGDIDLLRDLSLHNVYCIGNFSELFQTVVGNGKEFTNSFIECIIANYKNYYEEDIRQLLKSLCCAGDFDNAVRMIEVIQINFKKELNDFLNKLRVDNIKNNLDSYYVFIEKVLPAIASNKKLYAEDGNLNNCPIKSYIIYRCSFNICQKMFELYPCCSLDDCLGMLESVKYDRLLDDELFELVVDRIICFCKNEKAIADFFFKQLKNILEYMNETIVPYGVMFASKKEQKIIYKNNLSRLGRLIKNYKITERLNEQLAGLADGIWQNEKLYAWLNKKFPKETELIRLVKPL